MQHENIYPKELQSFYSWAIWLEGGFTKVDLLYFTYTDWCDLRGLKWLDKEDWIEVMKKHFNHQGSKDELTFLCTYNLLDTSEEFQNCWRHHLMNPLKLKEPLLNFCSQLHVLFYEQVYQPIGMNLETFRRVFAIPKINQ